MIKLNEKQKEIRAEFDRLYNALEAVRMKLYPFDLDEEDFDEEEDVYAICFISVPAAKTPTGKRRENLEYMYTELLRMCDELRKRLEEEV